MPKKASGELVACMEDVLRVYQRPSDARFPQGCLDETSKHLLADVQPALDRQPGQPARQDDEDERRGVCSVFLACEPLAGKRFVQARSHRSRQDWACFIEELLEVHYPQAEKVILVMDNLNTPPLGSLDETCAPAQAERLCLRLEIHSTPKHGSWVNMAEIELSALARQCVDRRLATLEQVQQEVVAWQHKRNQAQITIAWRFPTADARIKLKHLYPVIK